MQSFKWPYIATKISLDQRPGVSRVCRARAHQSQSSTVSADSERQDSLNGSSMASTTHSRPEDPIEIGIFGPPHGVRGGLRLFGTTESLEERLRQPGQRWAQRQKGRGQKPYVPVVIRDFRPTTTKGGQHWLVRVEGVNTIEEAEELCGQVLSMSARDRPEIEDDDEFYVQELIGMQVFLKKDDIQIGTVVDIFDGTGSHDLLQVRIDQPARSELDLSETAMIPFAKEIVPVVDRLARRLEILPPEGLLNIQGMLKSRSTPKKGKKRTKQKQITHEASEQLTS